MCMTNTRSLLQKSGILAKSYIRHKDFFCPALLGSGDPPLDSATGWTGELWLNRVFLILENWTAFFFYHVDDFKTWFRFFFIDFLDFLKIFSWYFWIFLSLFLLCFLFRIFLDFWILEFFWIVSDFFVVDYLLLLCLCLILFFYSLIFFMDFLNSF